MGLFDKKYCDFCGNKIGLLGNKKLEDGNMCRECAAKLSPWFSERRQSTKAEITEQLVYREENKKAVADFHTTRSIGRHTRLLIDEDAKKFMIASSARLPDANPDILTYDQITGCSLNIDESRHELKTKDQEDRPASYDPPRYEYSYNFYVELSVNHPYFDRMRWSVSNGYVKTGENPMPDGLNMHQDGLSVSHGIKEYCEYLQMGNEIKAVLEAMRLGDSLPAAEEFALTPETEEPVAMKDRIDRISEMETRLNQAILWLDEMEKTLDSYEMIQEDVRELSQYYGSEAWKEDFQADEAGLLPEDLVRGVLSEDGIHNVLERFDECCSRIADSFHC